MKHTILAVVALLMLGLGALHHFDHGEPQTLVSSTAGPAVAAGLVAVPVPPKPIQHSGVLRSPYSYREIIPPERFQRDTAVLAVFGDAAVVKSLCSNIDKDAIACSGLVDGQTPMLVAPNPCFAAANDLYAAILCHEIGHLNGWPKTHGD